MKSIYVTNIAWLGFEKVFRLIVSFYVAVAVIRYLGPEAFGTFSFIQSLLFILIAVASFGVDNIAIRNMAVQPNSEYQILFDSFITKLLGSVLASISLIIFAIISDFDLFFVLILVLTLLFNPLSVIDLYFQQKVKSKFSVMAIFVGVNLSSLLKLYIIHIDAGLNYILISLVLEKVFYVLVLLYFFYRNTLKINNIPILVNASLGPIFSMIRDGFPLLMANVFYVLYAKIDQIMLYNIASEAETGVYGAVVKITEVWLFVPMIVVSTLFPRMAVLVADGNVDTARFYMRRIYGGLFWISIIGSFIVSSFSREIMLLLFGDAYVSGSKILDIHMWSSVFLFFGVVTSKWMIVNDRSYLSMCANLSGLIINVTLNLTLIPKYGGYGAAIATVISYFVAYFVFCFFTKLMRGALLDLLKGASGFLYLVKFR